MCKKNTRICNISQKKSWKVTYPCIFLAHKRPCTSFCHMVLQNEEMPRHWSLSQTYCLLLNNYYQKCKGRTAVANCYILGSSPEVFDTVLQYFLSRERCTCKDIHRNPETYICAWVMRERFPCFYVLQSMKASSTQSKKTQCIDTEFQVLHSHFIELEFHWAWNLQFELTANFESFWS